jgi:3-hydroxybutyryl-CoA dehydrogenase
MVTPVAGRQRLRVLVVGAGLMGSQIGCEYLAAGHDVTWVVRSADRAQPRLRAALELAGRIDLGPLPAVGELPLCGDVRDRSDCDLVVESIAEELDAKAAVLAAAAAAHPRALLASNTSSLSITALGTAAGAPERTVGTHYWNPPLLMAQVEVVPGAATAAEHVATIARVLADLGKQPIPIARDVPGFAWNRLQFALLREAVWLLENGVATAEQVDAIVRDGLARRWRLTGPLETAALGGRETFERVAANLFGELSCATAGPDLAGWVPDDPEQLRRLAVRRDAVLAADVRCERRARVNLMSPPENERQR